MATLDAEFFRSGRNIFMEGDSGDRMYIVREGLVELSVHGKLIERVGKGGILGEMSLIDKKPRSASAKATTDCELVPVDDQQFLKLVQENPGFAIEVMKVLAERLRVMDARL